MAKYKFENFGVMIDCSRNAVMSVDALKRYFTLLKKMGYNCVMLYTEDTYEVDGEPYFGYMRGRYSKAEMKELDAFAASLGINLIPCVQTLAHFDAAVRWGTLPVDYGNTILTDDERSYVCNPFRVLHFKKNTRRYGRIFHTRTRKAPRYSRIRVG